jgi:hypothetical protein
VSQEAEDWSINFDVASEAVAIELAAALSEYGFTQVDGYPDADGAWTVKARSYGPSRGVGAYAAMERAAVRIARPFRGRRGLIRSGGPEHGRGQACPIMFDRPGVQPPVPETRPVAAPPPAQLPMAPDMVEAREPDLSALDTIDWTVIEAVFGPATEIPDRVRWLVGVDATGDPDSEWPEALEGVTELLVNSDDLWEAAAVTIPFLAELARCSGDPTHRRDLLQWLFGFATKVADDLILDADVAAIEDRAPAAARSSYRAHEVVGAEAASLLGTWPAQPPTVRFQLARLAAIYPQRGRWLRSEIASLAHSIPDTRHHVILRIALAMLDGRYTDAVVLAEPTSRWTKAFLDHAWLDAPGISDRTRAEHALGRSVSFD